MKREVSAVTVKVRPGWLADPDTGEATLSDGQRIRLVQTRGCPCDYCRVQRRRARGRWWRRRR